MIKMRSSDCVLSPERGRGGGGGGVQLRIFSFIETSLLLLLRDCYLSYLHPLLFEMARNQRPEMLMVQF